MEEEKETTSNSRKKPFILLAAAIYAISGICIALSPWFSFRYVEAENFFGNYSGLDTAGNFVLSLTVVGACGFLAGLSFLVKKPVPRYVPILFSITALLLSTFFCLVIRQVNPAVDDVRLALIFDETLWGEVKHLQTRSGLGQGLFGATLCSVVMCFLTPVLARRRK